MTVSPTFSVRTVDRRIGTGSSMPLAKISRWALSPTWAIRYFASDPLVAFLSLGGVVLVLTGADRNCKAFLRAARAGELEVAA